MKINRKVEWIYWKDHHPVDEKELVSLPDQILLRDIVGVEIPKGCIDVRSAYDTLKAQGETFLDGQILGTLWDKRCIHRTPLWNHEEFGDRSYAVFAGVLIEFNKGPRGWRRAFPTLYCEQNSPKIAMFEWEEPLSNEGIPNGFGGLHKSYFAVMRKK